jgi:hypothetical protein
LTERTSAGEELFIPLADYREPTMPTQESGGKINDTRLLLGLRTWS